MERIRQLSLPRSRAVQLLTGAGFLAGAMALAAAVFTSTDSGAAPNLQTAGPYLPASEPPQLRGAGGGSVAEPTAVTEEGAVPIPEPAQLPDEIERQTSGRFTMPLREWSVVTDRYGAR